MGKETAMITVNPRSIILTETFAPIRIIPFPVEPIPLRVSSFATLEYDLSSKDSEIYVKVWINFQLLN